MKEKIKTTGLIILCVLCLVLIGVTTCQHKDNSILENNIAALNDSVHTYQLKNGELMYEKQGYIAEKAELEKYIGIKESEIKEIEKKLKSALATIANLRAQVRIDTVQMRDSIEVLPDSTYNCHFNYNDKWLAINGTTQVKLDPFNSHTILNNINMEVPLKVGMTKDNKWFVTSENPYVQFTQVEGANLDSNKQKRWSLSLQVGLGGFVGYGASFPVHSGTVQSGIVAGVGLYGGLGFSYRLFDF
jgi:hypothetical protein